jgi:hypothetical protein
VAYLGFSAVANLAVGTDGAISLVKNSNILTDLLTATDSQSVFEKGCLALGNLVANEENRAQMTTICEGLAKQWVKFSPPPARLASFECVFFSFFKDFIWHVRIHSSEVVLAVKR